MDWSTVDFSGVSTEILAILVQAIPEVLTVVAIGIGIRFIMKIFRRAV
jgi:hypothetical protein